MDFYNNSINKFNSVDEFIKSYADGNEMTDDEPYK